MDEHTRAGEAGGLPAGSLPLDPDPGIRLPSEPMDAAPSEPNPWSPLAGGFGLTVWLVILLVLGGGGILGGQPEMAGLIAIAGLFATAQAADMDDRWSGLYRLIAWVAPVGGVLLFLAFANVVYESEMVGPLRTASFSAAVGGAVLSLFTIVPSFTRGLCTLLFRTAESHTLRLSARLIALGFWLSVTGGLASEAILEPLLESPEPLFAHFSPTGQTVGSLALALAAVGFLVRRSLRETLDRLGLGTIKPGHVAMIAIGVIALIGLNAGADVVQHWLLPDLWERDHRINNALALGLSMPRALAIGLMAGIGEEVTLRGALQPKLGLALTSLLFAVLHVQYSWFGMVVILAFGLVLGLIRARTNTSVVIAVHALYDMIVLVSVS